MPTFDINTVYAWEAWEMPNNMIEFTVRTSDGDVTGLINKSEAQALADRLYARYPGPNTGWERSMTE